MLRGKKSENQNGRKKCTLANLLVLWLEVIIVYKIAESVQEGN